MWLSGAAEALGPDGERATRAGGPALPFEARLELESADGAARSGFAVGLPIVLALHVRNASDAARSLELPSSQLYDFAIFAGDRELWRWSRGRMFAQMLTELRFEPGEEKVWRESFAPPEGAAAPLPPGRYRAEGGFRALGGLEVRAARDFAVE